MRESIREFELIHAPGFAQLDVSPAQVFVHIAGEEELAKSSKRENGDLVLRQVLLIHGTRTERVLASCWRNNLIPDPDHYDIYFLALRTPSSFLILERML